MDVPSYPKTILSYRKVQHSRILQDSYTTEPPLAATSLQRPLLFFPVCSPYDDSALNLYNGKVHLSVFLTPKITSRKRQEWS